MAKRYWLMKSEPESFSIDDLKAKGKSCWDGVRNYQARNFMRDDMKVGDGVLFYHSNAKPAGIAGIARVCAAAHPDHTALDSASPYYDPKATEENPIWMMVDVEFVSTLPRLISLAELKDDPELATMMVCQRGSRLSIQPVEKAHYDRVLKIAKKKAPAG